MVVLSILPGMVSALGLGNIELRSGLNQPFNASIELLSVTAEEISSLRVGLADSQAFRRAGIDRPFVLSELRFTVEETDSGPDYIRITSREPIREPFLNFLVEASWSRGRLFREYTVLLDPPLYDPGAGRSRTPAPATVFPAEPAFEPEPDTTAGVVTEPAVSSQTRITAAPGSADEYGPVQTGDTLWSLAARFRPDSSVSIQQMMLALQRANPEAFINNNINGLKRGQILRMPERNEINALTERAALAEVRSQYSMWDSIRGNIAAATPARPVSSVAAEVPATDEDLTDDREEAAELRLLAAGEAGGDASSEISATTAEEARVTEGLALANEQIEAISQENVDLQEQLSEAESIIEDLQRLIELKDDELAAIQQQLINANIEQEADAQAVADSSDDEAAQAGADDEQSVTEKTAAADSEPAVSDQPAVQVAAPAGLLATVRALVMDNLLIIGGILGGVIIAIGLLVFISRRKSSAGVAIPDAGPTDFPAYDDSEAETLLPGEEPENDFDEAETISEPDEITPVPAVAKPVAESPLDSTTQVVQGMDEDQDVEVAFEEEEEALAEVNVFLAYEHFDQAEEFVRDAIAGDPENLDYHSKLLEVFYASGNKAGYEAEARVLQGLVNSAGPHWEMALVMWQELSPNRALFEASEDDEEADAAVPETGGGVLDLTAQESGKSDTADSVLDFDLGVDDSASDTATQGFGAFSPDATAAQDDDEMLDFTTAVSSEEKEDLLDVTAAVGLEPEQENSQYYHDGDEDVFDITAGQDDDVLDITASSDVDYETEETEQDISLDFDDTNSDSGDLMDVTDSGGGNLLDVTHSHSDLQGDELEADLLDVTSATSAGIDADELLDVDNEATTETDDNSLDFDIGGFEHAQDAGDELVQKAEAVTDDNVIEFDMDITADKDVAAESGNHGNEIDFELDTGDTTAETGEQIDYPAGLELDLTDADGEDDGGLELTLDDIGADDENQDEPVAEDTPTGEEQGGFELEIDMDDSGADDKRMLDIGELEIGDGGIDLDVMGNNSSDDDIDYSDTMEIPKISNDSQSRFSAAGGLDFELESESDNASATVDDSNVQPRELELEMDDEDDDHTVFVPRSDNTEEQSESDEIATRLDLAKAYVELGDNDSARLILEEVIADGNEEQRRQAQELLDQTT